MAGKSGSESSPLEIAVSVRDACIAAAQEAYEIAGMSGLCAEGRWENALGAMETIDLKKIVGG